MLTQLMQQSRAVDTPTHTHTNTHTDTHTHTYVYVPTTGYLPSKNCDHDSRLVFSELVRSSIEGSLSSGAICDHQHTTHKRERGDGGGDRERKRERETERERGMYR